MNNLIRLICKIVLFCIILQIIYSFNILKYISQLIPFLLLIFILVLLLSLSAPAGAWLFMERLYTPQLPELHWDLTEKKPPEDLIDSSLLANG